MNTHRLETARPLARFAALLLPAILICFPARALPAANGPGAVGGSLGAIEIPFDMPQDGVATIGIYSTGGRLLRPLMQNVALAKGGHVVRWDGMDLFGNLLPAGTDVEVRVFSGPGLKAKWEFAIASPSALPWPTKPFGEGAAMRTGGWLGDHGVSASAVAVGDRMFFGSTMAEHGHTVIFTDLDGVKMWGRGGLEGWKGPRILASDGRAVFGVVEKNHVHRLELNGEASRQIIDTGDDEIVGMDAHDGQVVLTLKNHELTASVAAPVVGSKDFDFERCLPAPKNDKVYNNNLNGQGQFARAFLDGGHPQAGITPVANPSNASLAGIVAKWKKPLTVGTLLVERMDLSADIEVYALDQGVAFQQPVPGEAPGSGWTLLGKSDLSRRVNAIGGKSAVQTEAVYIRLQARGVTPPAKWPRLAMCRLLPRALERVDSGATIIAPASPGAEIKGRAADDPSWSFRATDPLTEASPGLVLIDLKKETAFDALVLQNCVNQKLSVDAWTGGGTPAVDGGGWKEIAVSDAGSDRIEGSRAASTNANDLRISLPRSVTTKALRLRIRSGMEAGRWGVPPKSADALRSDCADVALLRLREERPPASEMVLQIRDASTGDLIIETKDDSAAMTKLAFDAKGGLTSIVGNRLCRSVLPTKSGSPVLHSPLAAAKEFPKPTCLAVSADGGTIAVGDSDADTVFLFDGQGNPRGKIGGIGPRKRGPWNPETVDQPCAVAIDRNAKIWVCEKTYSPKRITRYSAEGKFEREFLGPPHYGGGGWLDPNLKSFWYEGAEYEVDFTAGTSRLKNLADVQGDPATPAPDRTSYSYTKVGRPVYRDGHRYIVGDPGAQYIGDGFVVCLYDNGATTWRPAAVMGSAQDSEFLTREDKPWSSHWLRQDLAKSSFIWCDLNGDGEYQVDEVQLFKNAEVTGSDKCPFGGAYWGSFSGDDLTFWGTAARLAPTRFTDKGVPVFEKEKIQPFDYSKLAPVYTGNILANQTAKTGYGAASLVARDGSLVLEGQPWRVLPDLTIAGGPVTEKPSDFTPRIVGGILDNPLSFVGSASTKSPVGEVAMLNGDNGRWFLWAVDHGVMLGEIFTGKNGGFGSVTEVVRGMDVTGYKQEWETFFGDFLGATNGNYYVVAGRGHWGVSRVEGIDGIALAKKPLRISAGDQAANAALRPQIVALGTGLTKKKEKREMKVRPLTARTKGFALDGDLADWGDPAAFQKIGTDGSFDAVWDADGLLLAWAGKGGTANNSQDWRYLFKTGFCVDFSLRTEPSSSGEAVARGDRRVVIGRHQGKWVAVLHDFVLPDGAGKEAVEYTSPVTSTGVDRVVLLPDSAVKIAVKEGGGAWSVEARIAWSALGIAPADGLKIRADAGILTPDSAGLQVDRRTNWADPDVGHVADLAIEAQIHPANFGAWILQP